MLYVSIKLTQLQTTKTSLRLLDMDIYAKELLGAMTIMQQDY